jgi:hypothetical protein
MIIFEVETIFRKKIKLTKNIWDLIVLIKHPAMKNKLNLVKEALINPDEIRRSIKDSAIHLYYKKLNHYFISVVCKHLNSEGFIITTYITDRIKEGEILWKKY